MSDKLKKELTELLDPLNEHAVNGAYLTSFSEFADMPDRDMVLCTWAAKWYLDDYLKNWQDFEDKGPSTPEELRGIIDYGNLESSFWSSTFDGWKNTLYSFGISQLDDIETDGNDDDFGDVVEKQALFYFQKHCEDILEKIRAIYAARNEHAINEADTDAVISNNLSDLRNPLNKENVDIFGLGNIPRCPDLTQDDYILWFAKLHINEGHDVLSPSNIRSAWCTSYTAFYGEEFGALGALFAICIFDPESIHGIESDVPIGNIANDCLSRFYDNNEDKIISKVKEIMKLWLEHDLL